MRRLRTYGLAAVLALVMSACGSEGEECDTCSSDSDCTGGLVCSNFSDGSKRCGTGTGTSCTVR